MVKARIIEDKRYYRLRSRQLLLFLVPALPLGIIVNAYDLPVWMGIGAISLYLLAFGFLMRNQRQIKRLTQNRRLEASNEEIRIIAQNGDLLQTFRVEDLDLVRIDSPPSLPQESIKDIGRELSGNPNTNILSLSENGQTHTFHLDIDSHYMVKQLEKLREAWHEPIPQS